MSKNTDPDFEKALNILLHSEEHVFLTGNAGTGKTTLINKFQSDTEKDLAIVAPTGVAAVNVGGETIHSFFGFPPNVNIDRAIFEAKKTKKAKIYQALEVLVIDEISMVRADLLDCIDIFLQTVRKMRVSFGGVRVIMVGDLHQLPPVVTPAEKEALLSMYSSPYFFSSHVFQKLMSGLYTQIIFLELQKIYRQTDIKFIDILNRIRTKSILPEDLDILNRCVIDSESIDEHILLTTINDTADKVNDMRLAQIEGPLHVFHATVTGDFSEKQSPASQSLSLKTGAKVMLLNNDPDDRWINGTIGTLFRVSGEEVYVKLENGEIEKVEPVTWNAYKTRFNEEENKLESFDVGSFKQLPLRLAWAITIHKSQGKTFQKVAIDFGRGSFAHGQTYVALSRATSLSGLKLLRPLTESGIIVDETVLIFLENIKKLSA
jgi:ATP-dependent exoDNAse (exonuclease V) alpha subunit